jgi:uncharacterized protein (TIGR04551 family)
VRNPLSQRPAPAAQDPLFDRASAHLMKSFGLLEPLVRLRALALGSAFVLTLSSGARAQAPAPAAPAKPADKPPPAAPPAATPAKPPADTAPADTAPAEPAPAEPARAPATLPEPSGPAPGAAPPGAGMPLWPEPSSDAAALERQGDARPEPKQPNKVDEADRVFAEDWWAHARPVFELHGYFRLRAQMFHKFGLGRLDPLARAMWPRPADDRHPTLGGSTEGASICTPDEVYGAGSDSASEADEPCRANMQSGANLRFRLNPELHISDNLRILSQVDLLDNLVLGSTPSGYDNLPGDGGYIAGSNSSLGFNAETQEPPSAGKNSFKDSVRVKRAWGEYAMPIGEIRFGRMPFHWGLGMMFNGGDGHDDDAQSTVDRAQIVSGIKPLDLYVSAAWDFPNEGVTSDTASLPNPEPYDLAQLDDVDQYTFSIARMKSPLLERQALARGELVLNGGLQLVYRHQTVANDRGGACGDTSAALGCDGYTVAEGYVRRDAEAWIPSLWLRLRYDGFRFETEAVTVQGSIANIDTTTARPDPNDEGYTIATWGVATEIEQKLVEDKLSLGFKFGWAQGDPDVDGLSPGTGGTLEQRGDRTFEQFRFHPSYRVDMILNRHILQRVQGTYYFRPSADYDFLRDPNGQRVGGGLAAIWTRASEFIQAPGHDRDLGIELNGRLYYQSKDGALNDVPGILGGFYTQLDYGILFPMGGLGYTSRQASEIINQERNTEAAQTRIAQTVRWYLGVLF